MAPQDWMSVKDTAEYLRVTPKAVYDFTKQGLPFSRLGKGRNIRIRREWVDRWMEESKTVNT